MLFSDLGFVGWIVFAECGGFCVCKRKGLGCRLTYAKGRVWMVDFQILGFGWWKLDIGYSVDIGNNIYCGEG